MDWNYDAKVSGWLKKPGKRSRLCLQDDVKDVLEENIVRINIFYMLYDFQTSFESVFIYSVMHVLLTC